jgi:hypothetical protein
MQTPTFAQLSLPPASAGFLLNSFFSPDEGGHIFI